MHGVYKVEHGAGWSSEALLHCAEILNSAANQLKG